MHRGRRGRLRSLCHWWSPVGEALQDQAGGSPVGGMDPQKHSVGVCTVQASLVTGTVPFGVSAGGWEREMVLVSAFVPR